MTRQSLVGFVFTIAVTAWTAACGSSSDGEPAIAQSVRGADPSCGEACPETCWVDIDESGTGYVGRWFIFDADQLNEPGLRAADVKLIHTGGNWAKAIEDEVPEEVPELLEVAYAIPGAFDVEAPTLEAWVALGNAQAPLECGYNLVD